MTVAGPVRCLFILLLYLLIDHNDSSHSLNSGRRFILAFLQNYDKTAALTMYFFTYDRPAVVNVFIPDPPYNRSVSIRANSTATMTLNSTHMLSGNQIATKTITVTSDEDISLVGLNGRSKTYDTFLTLPFINLGTKYYIITYTVGSQYNVKQFAIANSNEDVLITITVSGALFFNGTQYTDKESLTFAMDPYEVVQFQSDKDLTGTKVESTRPVAVFSGDQCISIPPNNCDHISEILYPVDKWSDMFVIFPFMTKTKRDIITIVSSENDTKVNIHTAEENWQMLLHEGGHVNITVNGGMIINSTKPIMVIYLFTGGSNSMVSTFDPFLLTVIPTVFFSNYFVFVTMDSLYNYILVISSRANAAGIMLDGMSLNTYPLEVSTFGGFTASKIFVGRSGGRHVISHVSAHFAIYIYGIGRAESYGYPMGNRPPAISSSQPLTSGRRFILAFLENADSSAPLTVHLVTYDKPTVVRVSISDPPYDRSVSIRANSTAIMTLNSSSTLSRNQTGKNTITVTSNENISLVAISGKSKAYNTLFTLPFTSLGTGYYIITYGMEGLYNLKQFTIANSNEHVLITITVSGSLIFNAVQFTEGESFSFAMGPNEVVQFQSKMDLTGTKIVSTKPVAVSSGDQCRTVTRGTCSNLSETLYPVDKWSDLFVVFPIMKKMKRDIITIVSSGNDNNVNIHTEEGNWQVLLRDGAHVNISVNGGMIINSSKPIMVIYLFTGGSNSMVSILDPFMMTVIPSVFFRNYFVFVTMDNVFNYILVISSGSNSSSIILDGKPLSKFPIKNSTFAGFTATRIYLGETGGRHVIAQVSGRFTIYTYGIRREESNGYPIGNRPPAITGSSQTLTSGRRFSLAFLENADSSAVLTVHVVTYDRPTVVSVSISDPPYDRSVSISANSTAIMTVNSTHMLSGTQISNKAITVTSDEDISLVVLNGKSKMNNIFFTLPFASLGTKYYIFTYPVDGLHNIKQFAIVNSNEQVLITITISGSLIFNGTQFTDTERFSFVLRPNNVIQFQSDEDLTGTKVESTKPVAVFSGDQCISITPGNCGQTSETLYPVDKWSDLFVVFPIMKEMTRDIITIVSSGNDNNVNIHTEEGNWEALLHEGSHINITVNGGMIINSTKPIMVIYLFTGSSNMMVSNLDPFFLTVIPSVFYSNYFVFLTLPNVLNYILVISSGPNSGSIILDGEPLSKFPIENSTFAGFTVTRTYLGETGGRHVISQGSGRFAIYTYGTRREESIGYLIGNRPPAISSSQPLTSGRRFSLAFLENADSSAVLIMHIVTYDRPTVVRVSIPDPPYNRSISISANSTATMTVNSTHMVSGTQISNKAITVTSDEDISLVVLNGKSKINNIFFTLPFASLGTKYYIFTYPVDGLHSIKQFAIVNSNEQVLITITVSGSLIFNGTQFTDTERFSFALRPNEVIQFQSDEDLTGTKVESTKPVAVFSGDQCISVTPGNCGHITETLYPVDKWSDFFVVFPIMKKMKRDIITIVSSGNDNNVNIHTEEGNWEALLHEGSHVNITVNGGMIINSTKPIMVIYLFTGGNNSMASTLDPFMMTVIPSVFFSNYFMFVTLDSVFNYILVISSGPKSSSIILDGEPLSKFTIENSTFAGFTASRIYLGETGGSHVISQGSGRFAIYTYGIRREESIGYPIGNKPPAISSSQTLTSGRRFILAFLENADSSAVLTMHIVTYDRPTVVRVSIPDPPYNRSISISANSTAIMTVNSTHMVSGTQISNKAITVTSDEDISLVVLNGKSKMNNIFFTLPFASLGTKYYIFTYSVDGLHSIKQFAIVNSNEQVLITITVSGSLIFNGTQFTDTERFSVALRPNKVIQFQSDEDLTGTKVESTKPVAVFSGDQCISITPGNCGQTSETLYPVDKWSDLFVVFPIMKKMKRDIITIVSSEDDNNVNIHTEEGNWEALLHEGSHVNITVNGGMIINSNKPIMIIYVFTGGSNMMVSNLDPFLLTVIPSVFYSNYFVFITLPNVLNYILVISSGPDSGSIILDGEPLSTFPFENSTFAGFTVTRIYLGETGGRHVISQVSARFAIYTYGIRREESNGHPIGNRLPSRGSTQSLNIGRRFSLAFLENADSSAVLTMHVVTYDRPTVVSVSIPDPPYDRSVSISANSTAIMTVNSTHMLSGNQIANKAITVTSDENISLVVFSGKSKMHNIFFTLPSTTLGTKYYIFTYPVYSLHNIKQFAIANSNEQVLITITVSGSLIFNGTQFTDRGRFSFALRPNNVIQFQSNKDLTGTKVESTKPVAVFSGDQCISVPPSNDGHVNETLYPVDKWAHSFIVVPIMKKTKRDIITLVSSGNDTNVNIHTEEGNWEALLHEGSCANITVNGGIIINTSKPIMVVYLFTSDSKSLVSTRDTFMMTLIPPAFFSNYFMFMTLDNVFNYILVISSGQNSAGIKLDRAPLNTYPIENSTFVGFSAIKIYLGETGGRHFISHDSAHFGIYIFVRVRDEPIRPQIGKRPAPISSSQTLTSGRRFSLAFLENADSSAVLTMHVVTYDRPTVVRVSIPDPPYDRSVSISANSTATMTVNSTHMLSGNQITNKAITVTSDEDISLVVLIGKSKTYDTFLTLPFTSFGTKYYIITYPVDGLHSIKQFAIVNSNEQVLITITVSGSLIFNGTQFTDTERFSFALRPNEVIQFQSDEDLTGTKVESTKPVAVFSGEKCTNVPPNNCGHFSENLYPVDKWSNFFVVFPIMKKTKRDVITIVSSGNDNNVNIHTEEGNWQVLLHDGAHVNITVNGGMIINSTKPIMVLYLCTGGNNSMASTFDPFMLTIPPVFFRNYFVFVTMDNVFNYILVISSGQNSNRINLDGKPLSKFPSENSAFAGFTAIRIYLGETGGRHVISQGSAGFSIYILGIGQSVSYGYPMGNRPLTVSEARWGSLTCLPTSAVYILPSSVLASAKLSPVDVHLIDPSCQANQRDENWVVITAPFNSCGTMIINDTGRIAYVNTIYGTAPHTSIHRLQIRLNCEMLTVENITIAFVPQTDHVVRLGHNNVSFTLYQSAAFNDPIFQFPYEVELNNTLYVQMEVDSTDSGMEVFTENCVSVPFLTSNSETYSIIENGCPKDSTFVSYQFDDQRKQRFSFHVFKFDAYLEVYIICEVVICHKGSTPNRCAKGCIPAKYKRDVGLQMSKDKSAYLSQGPIVFRRDLGDLIRLPLNPERSGSNGYLPVLGLLSVGFLISFLALIVQRRYYLQQFWGNTDAPPPRPPK
ncbi:uncharacterized protein [Scyliorhinus torazame]